MWFFCLLSPQLLWHAFSFQNKWKYIHYFGFMCSGNCSALCLSYSVFVSDFSRVHLWPCLLFELDSNVKKSLVLLITILQMLNSVAFFESVHVVFTILLDLSYTFTWFSKQQISMMLVFAILIFYFQFPSNKFHYFCGSMHPHPAHLNKMLIQHISSPPVRLLRWSILWYVLWESKA